MCGGCAERRGGPGGDTTARVIARCDALGMTTNCVKMEVLAGTDRLALSEAVVGRCQDVFKLKMDSVEFLAEGTLPEGHEKLVDRRWT